MLLAMEEGRRLLAKSTMEPKPSITEAVARSSHSNALATPLTAFVAQPTTVARPSCALVGSPSRYSPSA